MERDKFWEEMENQLDPKGAGAIKAQPLDDPALSRSRSITIQKRMELIEVFLLGTHSRVGLESDVRILSSGPESRRNPLEMIFNILLSTDDQEVYREDISKRRGKIGDYVFEKRIGKGTYGKVYQGTYRRTGYQVAIKALNKKKIAAQKMTEKVMRETKILRRLSEGKGHPHVVRLYDVYETPTKYYMVMDLCPGGDFFDFLSFRGSVSEDEARVLFLQMLSGVSYCHQRRICHRDLKPENILIDSECNIKIADFSLANEVSALGDAQDAVVLLETSCGSPNYAAPEIISGKSYNGFQVDVWSMGVILYSLVCGALPFDDDNPIHLFKAIKAGDYPPPPAHLSEACRGLLRAMLTTEPRRRATVQQVQEHGWCRQASQASSASLLAYAPFAPAEGGDSDGGSTDGSESEEELRPIIDPVADTRRGGGARRENSGAAEEGRVLEVVYRSSFTRDSYLSYTLDGTVWNARPGERMTPSADVRFPSPWVHVAVRRERWGKGGIRLAFNDGAGKWDNNGGPTINYRVPGPGYYSIEPGADPQPVPPA